MHTDPLLHVPTAERVATDCAEDFAVSTVNPLQRTNQRLAENTNFYFM